MSVTSVRRPALLLAASSLVLSACLDLELPNVPADGGAGPELTIHSPLEGDTIALNAPVSLDAASVNGVSSVTVTCGGAPSTGVFSLERRAVHRHRRLHPLHPGDERGERRGRWPAAAHLHRRRHAGPRRAARRVNVFLDTTTASLSAVLPERVAPLAPLTLTVGSDRPLAPAPHGPARRPRGRWHRPARQPRRRRAAVRRHLHRARRARHRQLRRRPVQRPLRGPGRTWRGRSASPSTRGPPTGTPSHLEQGVLLSRVLWDRLVPGRIAIDAAEPVATARGIQVALAKTTTVNATSDWLPGLLPRQRRHLRPVRPEQHPGLGPAAAATPPDASGGTGRGDGGSGNGSTEERREASTRPERCRAHHRRRRGGDRGPAAAITIPDGGTIPFPQDAGFVAADFDAHGNVLFTRHPAHRHATSSRSASRSTGPGRPRATRCPSSSTRSSPTGA